MKSAATILRVRGEELMMHPARAVLWPRRKTVIVADTHFGKSGFFARHGIPVPAGTDDQDRRRLSELVATAGAERLIILGDFLHAPLPEGSDEMKNIDTWSQQLRPLQIIVIAGNHDRGVRTKWSSIDWLTDELQDPPFCFRHEAAARREQPPLFTLSGHVHPVTKLSALRKAQLRVPVFWQRTSGLVLPSFGGFTGGFLVRPGPAEHLFAVAPDAVVQIR